MSTAGCGIQQTTEWVPELRLFIGQKLKILASDWPRSCLSSTAGTNMMLFSTLHHTASHLFFLTRMLAMRCRFYKYLFCYVCAVSQTNMLWCLHCIIYQYMYCDACITSQYIHSRFWRSTKHWSLLPRSHIWFPTTSLLIDWTGSRKKGICRHLNERQKIRPPPPTRNSYFHFRKFIVRVD